MYGNYLSVHQLVKNQDILTGFLNFFIDRKPPHRPSCSKLTFCRNETKDKEFNEVAATHTTHLRSISYSVEHKNVPNHGFLSANYQY